ncbi:MAG: DUF1549 and DUF1553 domain-containing protein [Pirellulales bacterium]|nr:DUF1549 and DUF1553 domain-containing protein [Pirellulales bacterium]
MAQELTPQRLADEPEFSDQELVGDDDAGLASMLSDAYEAPPVPKSLVKRLDEGIEEQWGVSPKLVSSRLAGGLAVVQTGSVWLRSWPVAAGLAAVLMLAFVFGGGSKSYAWAAVVDAMKRHGVIEMNDDAGVRWLDLAKHVAGQQSNQQTRWLNVHQRVMLTRAQQSNTLRCTHFGDDLQGENSDPLIAAFLLNQPLSAETLDRLSGIKLVDQQWKRQTHQGREVIDLQVQFQTASLETFSFSLLVHPESELPVAVRGVDGEVSALNYLEQSSEELQSVHFPAHLAIVDSATEASVDSTTEVSVDSTTEASGGTAALDRLPEPAHLAKDSESEGTGSEGSQGVPATEGDLSPASRSGAKVKVTEHSLTSTASLPIGAANKWAPVAVVRRTDEEVLRRVDWVLEELWKSKQVEPVAAATDLELLRRAYLDLAGRTPRVAEVRAYLKDQGADRYERLVDDLLSNPDHASQMAAVWRAFLIPEGVDLDAFGGREAFEKWLADRFSAGESYDQIVRKLLLAEGRLSQSGPLLFYSALKLDADQLASRTSRVFLGMRLECAQCHDHPFEPWTQEDFWSYAAFFAQISRPKGELENVSTVMRVRDVDHGDVMLPETDMVVPPRFLGESLQQDDQADDAAHQARSNQAQSKTSQSKASQSSEARRVRLAKWLTGPENPYFARATVNRVWSQFFGRGIVDPVDDFGLNNQPISPELLDTLASQFIASGYDLKKLIRSIVLTRAYRLSSRSAKAEKTEAEVSKRLEMFAQMNVKTLTAEQLYDCIAVTTMFDGGEAADYSLARFGNGQREAFLQQFAAPVANRSEYQGGIPQALTLMNGSLITAATGEQSSGLILALEAPFFSDRQRIDVLFMATLSRPATEEELKLFAEFLPADASPAERSAGLSDLLWALINTAEFTLNH